MFFIKGYHNIKFGKVIKPKKGLPYIKIILLKPGAPDKTIEAGSVIWDLKKKQWELRTRKETDELVKEMGGER